jgi:hypothetical protein
MDRKQGKKHPPIPLPCAKRGRGGKGGGPLRKGTGDRKKHHPFHPSGAGGRRTLSPPSGGQGWKQLSNLTPTRRFLVGGWKSCASSAAAAPAALDCKKSKSINFQYLINFIYIICFILYRIRILLKINNLIYVH